MIRKAALFSGCSYRYYYPEVTGAAKAVLELFGFQVTIPPQSCCGLPMLAKGNETGARRNVHQNAERLGREIAKGFLIVTICPSCHLFLTRHGGNWFGGQAAVLSPYVRFFSDLLWELRGGYWDRIIRKEVNKSVFYQVPCHLTACDIGQPSLELMGRVPGIEVRKVSSACCGLSGTYGYDKDRYDISQSIGRKVFSDLKENPAETVVTDCMSCRSQIEAGTGLKPIHPLQLLADALVS
jgi:glycerol-3-phosphate dehydrogenase subunit C